MSTYYTGPNLTPYKAAVTVGLTMGVMSGGPGYDEPRDHARAAVYAGSIIYIWNRTRILSASFSNPITIGATVGAIVGVATSGLLFGVEGVTRSTQFYTGQGNYLYSDPHGSGYFNVPKNLMTIYDKTDWLATSGMKVGSPEHAAYERDYWSQYREAASYDFKTSR